jgi:hypothetical protein
MTGKLPTLLSPSIRLVVYNRGQYHANKKGMASFEAMPQVAQ